MDIELPLIKIEKVSSNHCLNIEIQLNDDYRLLLVDSFSIYQNNKLLLTSEQFVKSNFSDLLLDGIKILMEEKRVVKAICSDSSGVIQIHLEDGVVIESNTSEKDVKSWQLVKSSQPVYGSENGQLVYY